MLLSPQISIDPIKLKAISLFHPGFKFAFLNEMNCLRKF